MGRESAGDAGERGGKKKKEEKTGIKVKYLSHHFLCMTLAAAVRCGKVEQPLLLCCLKLRRNKGRKQKLPVLFSYYKRGFSGGHKTLSLQLENMKY